MKLPHFESVAGKAEVRRAFIVMLYCPVSDTSNVW